MIVSEDTDFGALLARAGARAPSFVLIRSAAPMTPDAQAFLIVAALGRLVDDLDAGCIAVVNEPACGFGRSRSSANERL